MVTGKIEPCINTEIFTKTVRSCITIDHYVIPFTSLHKGCVESSISHSDSQSESTKNDKLNEVGTGKKFERKATTSKVTLTKNIGTQSVRELFCSCQ